jgi:hypothetical protein
MESDEINQPGDSVGSKRVFMALVRKAAKPYVADGWQVGGSGLRRRADTGHWAHFWFSTRSVRRNVKLTLQLGVGTASPYLLRVFNRQRTDRVPHPNLIAVHSQIQPVERGITFEPDGGDDGASLDEIVDDRALTSATLPGWLERRFGTLLPELVALSSDEALLAWLTDDALPPSSGRLRYAALLAYHLRRDAQMEAILVRADDAKAGEDSRSVASGFQLGNRDRQITYPQDWSHVRFVRFLHACPRD